MRELKTSGVSFLSRSLSLLSGALKGNLMNNEEKMRCSKGEIGQQEEVWRRREREVERVKCWTIKPARRRGEG
ncbi:unnamed protein product [Leuciscus chuanchicus]